MSKPRPPAPVIRPAGAEDIEAMVGLLGELFAIEADFDFDPVRQRRALELLLERRGEARLLVAELDGEAIAMASLQVLISTAEGGRVGLLEDLVVKAAHRGRGVGTQLIEALEAWADQQALQRLQLLADRDNQAARRFYAARGWRPTRLIALRRDVRNK